MSKKPTKRHKVLIPKSWDSFSKIGELSRKIINA